MADVKSCETCAYIGKSENDYPCNKCTRNASDKWKPMTNADKIRSMSDEELAEFFREYFNCEYKCEAAKEECYCDCNRAIMEWLQSKADIPKGE